MSLSHAAQVLSQNETHMRSLSCSQGHTRGHSDRGLSHTHGLSPSPLSVSRPLMGVMLTPRVSLTHSVTFTLRVSHTQESPSDQLSLSLTQTHFLNTLFGETDWAFSARQGRPFRKDRVLGVCCFHGRRCGPCPGLSGCPGTTQVVVGAPMLSAESLIEPSSYL